MPEFTKLSGEPILQTSAVPSKASGHAAMSQIFGEVGRVVTKEVDQIHNEHSNSMLLNANAQLNSLQADTKVKMARSPGQAADIAKNAEKSLETISQTKLNSSDRGKLNYTLQGTKDNFRMQAANAEIKQNRLENTTNFWSAYNESMPQYSEALTTGDFKHAEIVSDSILETAKSAVMDQLITPQAFENINKSLMASNQRATELHQLLESPNATAQDLHTAALDPFSSDGLGVSELPSNHGTHALTNHYTGSMTQNDVDNDIYNWNITPNTANAILNQSGAEFTKTAQKLLGSREAHGLLNSNPSYPEVENRINLLENKAVLSSKEQSELQVYKGHMKELNSGNYWSIQGRTSLGSQALNEWNSDKSVIENHVSYALTAEGQAANREKMLAHADNKLIDRGVSIGEGSHMDPRFIRPVPEVISNQVQSAFNMDGDPQQALNQISRLRMRNRGYLGQQMKQGPQKEVITAVGFGQDNNMSPNFAKSYISANKDGMDYSALKTEDTQRDSTIRSQIANNSAGIIKLMAASGGAESAQRINDFTNSALKYVKFRALQSGDMNIDNLDTYVDEFSTEMGHAYNISERRFGTLNTNQIPLSSSQQDILQNYVYNEAEKSFMGDHKADGNFQGRLSKTDITVYVDSTNHVIAKDQDGNSLFYAPYSDNLMASASHHHEPVEITPKEQENLNAQIKQFGTWYLSD